MQRAHNSSRGLNISSKLIVQVKFHGNYPHTLYLNSLLRSVSIFCGVCDPDSVKTELTDLQMTWFYVIKLTSSSLYQWDFFAEMMLLKVGGSSAFCMRQTRITDAWHLKPYSKDSPRIIAINYRIFNRCQPGFHFSKSACCISMFLSWICVS